MNTNKFCPSCGEPTTPDMKSCPNCGENLTDGTPAQTDENEALRKAQAILEETETSKDGIRVGSRSNVVGGITGRKIETQSHVENTSTHVEANTTNSVSTSHVDNSQKVVNSSTNNVTYNIIYQNAGPGNPQPPGQGGASIPGFIPPEQPAQAVPMPQTPSSPNGPKGIGAIAGGQGGKPKTDGGNNGNMKKIMAICVGLAIVVGLFLALRKPGEPTVSPKDGTPREQVEKITESPYTERPASGRTSAPGEAAPAGGTAPASAEKAAPPAAESTDANYENGMKAYRSQDGPEAVKWFKSSGSAESNYMLGIIYEQGCGNVAANAMMARKYFKTAAGMGSGAAKAKL